MTSETDSHFYSAEIWGNDPNCQERLSASMLRLSKWQNMQGQRNSIDLGEFR